MKDKIEAKMNQVIEHIIAKNPEDISYNEYRILDNRLSTIKWEQEQERKDKDMAELMGKAFGYGLKTAPAPLPDVKEE